MGRRSVSMRAAAIWLVGLVTVPGAASSQQLRGILSDEASYAPVVSATVHLLNADGDTLGESADQRRRTCGLQRGTRGWRSSQT